MLEDGERENPDERDVVTEPVGDREITGVVETVLLRPGEGLSLAETDIVREAIIVRVNDETTVNEGRFLAVTVTVENIDIEAEICGDRDSDGEPEFDGLSVGAFVNDGLAVVDLLDKELGLIVINAVDSEVSEEEPLALGETRKENDGTFETVELADALEVVVAKDDGAFVCVTIDAELDGDIRGDFDSLIPLVEEIETRTLLVTVTLCL